MRHKIPFIAAIAGLGLAGAAVYAANQGAFPITLSAGAARVSAAADAAPAAPASAQRSFATAARGGASAKKPTAPTLDDVGDLDSFGRNVRWLGVTNAFVQVSTDCASVLAEDPTALCQQVANLGGTTAFAFNDIARIRLPAKASHSLLCHWFSPRVSVSLFNPTAAPVLGRYAYNPTLTVENPVLDDPALIDASTGLPFNGKLATSMSASESMQVVVDPAFPITHNQRDSAVCQAGLLSRRALVETYGLTAAQAEDFFDNPTTVRLNVSGSTRYVEFALFSLGLRLVGD